MTASQRVERRHLVWPFLSKNLIGLSRLATGVGTIHNLAPVVCRPYTISSTVMKELVNVSLDYDEATQSSDGRLERPIQRALVIGVHDLTDQILPPHESLTRHWRRR